MNLTNKTIKKILLLGLFGSIGTLLSMDDEKSASSSSASSPSSSTHDKQNSMSFDWPSSKRSVPNSSSSSTAAASSHQMLSSSIACSSSSSANSNTSSSTDNAATSNVLQSSSSNNDVNVSDLVNNALNVQSTISYEEFLSLFDIFENSEFHYSSKEEYDDCMEKMKIITRVLQEKTFRPLVLKKTPLKRMLRQARNFALQTAESLPNIDLVKGIFDHGCPIKGYKNDAEPHLSVLIIGGRTIRFDNNHQRFTLPQDLDQNASSVMQFFLENGVEADGKDSSGKDFSHLYQAVYQEKMHFACLLLSYGAHVNGFGDSPMAIAIEHCKIKLLKLLIAHNANVNHLTKTVTIREGKDYDYNNCVFKTKQIATSPIKECAEFNSPGLWSRSSCPSLEDCIEIPNHLLPQITAIIMLAGADLYSTTTEEEDQDKEKKPEPIEELRKIAEEKVKRYRSSANLSNFIKFKSPTLAIRALLESIKEDNDVFMDKDEAQKLRNGIKAGKLTKHVGPESDDYSVKDMIKDRFKTQTLSKQDLLFKAQKQSVRDGRKHKKQRQSEQNIFRKLYQRQLGNLTQKNSTVVESGNELPRINHDLAGIYVVHNKKSRKTGLEAL